MKHATADRTAAVIVAAVFFLSPAIGSAQIKLAGAWESYGKDGNKPRPSDWDPKPDAKTGGTGKPAPGGSKGPKSKQGKLKPPPGEDGSFGSDMAKNIGKGTLEVAQDLASDGAEAAAQTITAGGKTFELPGKGGVAAEAVTSFSGTAGAGFSVVFDGGDPVTLEQELFHGTIDFGLGLAGGIAGSPGGPVGAAAGSIAGGLVGQGIRAISEPYWDLRRENISIKRQAEAMGHFADTMGGNSVTACAEAKALLASANAKQQKVGAGVQKRIGEMDAVIGSQSDAVNLARECGRQAGGAGRGVPGDDEFSSLDASIDAVAGRVERFNSDAASACSHPPENIPTQDSIAALESRLGEFETGKEEIYGEESSVRAKAVGLKSSFDTANENIATLQGRAARIKEKLNNIMFSGTDKDLIPIYNQSVTELGKASGLIAACERGARITIARLENIRIETPYMLQDVEKYQIAEAKKKIAAAVDSAKALLPQVKEMKPVLENLQTRSANIQASISAMQSRFGTMMQVRDSLSPCEALEPLNTARADEAISKVEGVNATSMEAALGDFSVCLTKNKSMLGQCGKAMAKLDEAGAIITQADGKVSAANDSAGQAEQSGQSAYDSAKNACGEIPSVEEIEGLKAELAEKVAKAESLADESASQVSGICSLRNRYVSEPEILDLIQQEITNAQLGLVKARQKKREATGAANEAQSVADNLSAKIEQRDKAINSAKQAKQAISTARRTAETAQQNNKSALESLAGVEPLFSAAREFRTCPDLDSPIATLTSKKEAVVSKINQLVPDYALFHLESQETEIGQCADMPTVDARQALAGARALTTKISGLDGSIAAASECLAAIVPHEGPPDDTGPSPEDIRQAEGDGPGGDTPTTTTMGGGPGGMGPTTTTMGEPGGDWQPTAPDLPRGPDTGGVEDERIRGQGITTETSTTTLTTQGDRARSQPKPEDHPIWSGLTGGVTEGIGQGARRMGEGIGGQVAKPPPQEQPPGGDGPGQGGDEKCQQLFAEINSLLQQALVSSDAAQRLAPRLQSLQNEIRQNCPQGAPDIPQTQNQPPSNPPPSSRPPQNTNSGPRCQCSESDCACGLPADECAAMPDSQCTRK